MELALARFSHGTCRRQAQRVILACLPVGKLWYNSSIIVAIGWGNMLNEMQTPKNRISSAGYAVGGMVALI